MVLARGPAAGAGGARCARVVIAVVATWAAASTPPPTTIAQPYIAAMGDAKAAWTTAMKADIAALRELVRALAGEPWCAHRGAEAGDAVILHERASASSLRR